MWNNVAVGHKYFLDRPSSNQLFNTTLYTIAPCNRGHIDFHTLKARLTGLVSLTVAMCFRENFAYIFFGWK